VRSYWGGDHSLFLGQVEVRATARAGYSSSRRALRASSRDRAGLSLLPRELLDPILALGQEREYADGEPIMQIGEEGCDLLLVLEGEARVDRPGRSLTIGPGELIGEIEVLDPGGGRIADIHAVGPVRTIGVSRQQLLSALEADPRAAIALIEVLAARFRETA
jgi:CRP-like cAMP-binding protein